MNNQKISWTEEQSTAIGAHCADNLVSAAAGSGKTAVMVERIVNRIVEGLVDIDKILVVTFTNAAASELKSRLMSKIMDKLDRSENSDRLNRQLVLINNASICTIDSFCLDILRNNFYKLNLDPDIKVGDGAELEIIKSDVLNKVFEKYYVAGDAVFLNLVNSYTQKNDKDLMAITENIFKFTNTLSGGVSQLTKLKETFNECSVWEDYFLHKAHNICRHAIVCYDEAISQVEGLVDFEKVYNQLIDEKNNYVLADSRKTWDEMKSAIDAFVFPPLKFPKGTEEADKDAVKVPREQGKFCKDELIDIFKVSYDELCRDIKKAEKHLDKLIEIVTDYAEEYAIAKRGKGIIDFVDVEHMALSLLRDDSGKQTALAVQLMQKYDEIYVDEYQDCNEVQENLFSLISRANIGEPNMFMVGDMKQSIYGFRGSEPSLFKNKADNYPLYESNNKFNKILLNLNFRSRKCIIDSVNSVFSQIMSLNCGELEYNYSEYLYYKEGAYEDKNPDTHSVDIAFVETGNDFNDFNDSEGVDAYQEMKGIEAEGIYIAEKIKAMVTPPDGTEPYLIYDKETNTYRKAKYSDIVVLLRAGGEKAATLNRIFNTYQIPVYCDFGTGYFDAPEVSFLIDFLKIIDNPYDDIALLSVMRHPVIGFTDNDFLSIRISKSRGFFYSSVLQYIKDYDTPLKNRLSDFTNMLRCFYDVSKYLPTDKLIDMVIEKTDYMSYLCFMYNPELRKANVSALMTRAYEFEKTSYRGIFDFIKYVDNLKKNNKDIEPAKTLSDDEDVVRIMTIHKSKGLEFPVVFLADSCKQFNDRDIKSDKILLDKEYGFGVNFYDYNSRYYYELPQKRLIKEKKYRKMLSEELRILYVALTRPKEKLFITGSGRNINARIEKLSKLIMNEEYKLSSDVSASAKSYGDWILMSVLRNSNLNSNLELVNFKTKVNDNSAFRLDVIPKSSLVLNIPEEETGRNIDVLSFEPDLYDKVSHRLDFIYSGKILSDIPSNMSVTELKRKNMEEEDVFNYYKTYSLPTPRFISKDCKLTAAEKGTLVHYFFEKLDFSRITDLSSVKNQLDELVNGGFISAGESSFIDCEKVYDILNTNVGREMIQCCNTLKREFNFKIPISASSVFEQAPSSEIIVVQGMIDAYYTKSDGSLVIIDYKTDKVNNTDEILKKYSLQLKYYKLALEKALGKPVANTYLMLVDIGQAVEVN